MKKTFLRRAGLAVLVLATVAGVVAGREKPAAEALNEAPARRPKAATTIEIDLAKLERVVAGPPQADPFAPRSFAPARAEAPAAPPKPVAPPLPFQYMGKVIENGKPEVYVMRGDELLLVQRGKKLGGDYRVERVTEKAITFTYLPLKMQQTLDIPAVN